jgi:hypothetical protein
VGSLRCRRVESGPEYFAPRWQASARRTGRPRPRLPRTSISGARCRHGHPELPCRCPAHCECRNLRHLDRCSAERSPAESDALAWSLGSPGGGVGPREVDARYLRGTWQVDQGHRPGRQVAVVLAWQVTRYAICFAVCGYRVSADSPGAVSVRVTAADQRFVRLGTRSPWRDALVGTGSARWFAQVRRFRGQCPWLSVRWVALMPVGTDI